MPKSTSKQSKKKDKCIKEEQKDQLKGKKSKDKTVGVKNIPNPTLSMLTDATSNQSLNNGVSQIKKEKPKKNSVPKKPRKPREPKDPNKSSQK